MPKTATIAAIRFGYGLPLPEKAPADPVSMIEYLAGEDRAAAKWPGNGLAQVLPVFRASAAARAVAKESDANREAYRETVKMVTGQALQSSRITMARALSARDGFRERLVRFWADHFTTVSRQRQDRAMPLAMVEDAIRPHVAGRFADMLKAVTLHPGMLIYLDQVASIGPNSSVGLKKKRGLNENLARELIELHTMGVGASYSQTDVTQMAELLTGLRFDPAVGMSFDANWVEPGPETVLGRSYDGEGTEPILAALDDLAARPETAAYLARKLVVHFIADLPEPSLVKRLTQVFTATGGDLLAVYTALLDNPAAWAMPMIKARQPYDFLIAGMRSLGLGAQDVLHFTDGRLNKQLLTPMTQMGMQWLEPRGPDGWPEAAADWITPQGLAARIDWAMDAPARLVKDLPDPREFAVTALGDMASERLVWAVARAEDRREGVGLVLASPEFNRR